jgi:hypothetical protein
VCFVEWTIPIPKNGERGNVEDFRQKYRVFRFVDTFILKSNGNKMYVNGIVRVKKELLCCQFRPINFATTGTLQTIAQRLSVATDYILIMESTC